MNFIIKSITRSLIMLNTMKENENASFADISIPFLRWCSQHRSCSQYRSLSWHPDLRKGIEILAKLVFSFSFIVLNMMKLLVILFIMTLKCFCFLASSFFDCLRCLKRRRNFFLPRACFLSDISWRLHVPRADQDLIGSWYIVFGNTSSERPNSRKITFCIKVKNCHL